MVMAVLLFAMPIAIYAFWIRPILQSRPAFRDLYRKEANFFGALSEKLKGIKQRLSSATVIFASAAVTGYDFFVPIVGGVDVSSRLHSRGPSRRSSMRGCWLGRLSLFGTASKQWFAFRLKLAFPVCSLSRTIRGRLRVESTLWRWSNQRRRPTLSQATGLVGWKARFEMKETMMNV